MIRNPGIWERVLVWMAQFLANVQRHVEDAAFRVTWARVNPEQQFDDWVEEVAEAFTEPAVRDALLADTAMRSQVLIQQKLERAGLFANTDGDALFTRDNPGRVR